VKITVTTPTGHIGGKLANLLLSRQAEITLIARNPDKVKNLTDRGAHIVRGEHNDTSVLEQATQGADALFWVTPPLYSSHDPLGDARVFAKAGAAAVQQNPNMHVVLISSIGAHRPTGTGPIAGLYETESLFRAVARKFTALRPNYFMENVFNALQTIVAEGNIYTSVPGSVSALQVATQDIAEVAADVLLAGGKGQKVIDLVGPDDISLNREAEIIASQIGKQVQVVTIPAEKMHAALKQAGISSEMASLFIEMESTYAHGLTRELRGDEKRTGKVTYPQFIREVFVPAYRKANTFVA